MAMSKQFQSESVLLASTTWTFSSSFVVGGSGSVSVPPAAAANAVAERSETTTSGEAPKSAGDDYAAMAEALRRRYTRVKKGEVPMPDILFVDGGKGQLAEALTVLDELELDWLRVVAVAKGRSRRPGAEQLFLAGQDTATILPADSPALHLIQQIRDEAHRFAITGHRQRRAKKRNTSRLEEIPGLGPKRRRELLRQFGGLQGIRGAGVDDLVKVRGISRSLAQKIYDDLHLDGGS
jgi:excinuclease ABC subunit C